MKMLDVAYSGVLTPPFDVGALHGKDDIESHLDALASFPFFLSWPFVVEEA